MRVLDSVLDWDCMVPGLAWGYRALRGPPREKSTLLDLFKKGESEKIDFHRQLGRVAESNESGWWRRRIQPLWRPATLYMR